MANRDVRDLAFAATASIAAINDGKLFYSSNGGSNWQQTSSDINPFFYAVQFVNNQQAYAGANDGVYLSNDSGVTWSKIRPQNGSEPLLINAMHYDGNTLWIGTNESGIWQITPNSTNFQQHNDGLIANTEEELVIWDILAVSPTEIYLATDTGVFRGNAQTAWRSFGLERVPVLSLAVADDLIYAGTKANGLRYRRLDASTDWLLIADPKIGNAPIRDLHYDQSTLCRDPITGRNALLVGTKDGILIYQ